MSVYFNRLDHAVFFTLAYSNYFSFPLIESEIESRLPKVWDWQFFIGRKTSSDELEIKKEKMQIEKSLEKLLEAKKIEKKRVNQLDYYFLKGRKELVELRITREKIANKRKRAIKGFLDLARFLPTIKAVVLTGSSTMNNAELDDDLDFCLITKKNTLWISRFFLIFLAKLLGKRPQIDAQSKADSKQAWCFNLWLDESSLEIIRTSFSIYQAYEVKQMRWLSDKDHLKSVFLFKNRQLDQLLELNLTNDCFDKKDKNTLLDYFFWPINLFFYYLQNVYRYLFFGKENYRLSFHQAHFNELRRQQTIFSAIKKKMKENAFSIF